MILALVNNKGGVGKTTCAVNLAAAIARKDRPVLLVDLDSQASASFSVGLNRDELHPSTAELLLERVPASRTIRATGTEGLDVLAGSMGLVNADLRLADDRDRTDRLRIALSPVAQEYAYIILDTPPSLGLVTVNALVAADAYVVPVVPHYLALEGLVSLLEAVERIRSGVGTVAELLGLALVQVDRRVKMTDELVQLFRGHYKRQVFKTEVPINVRLTEAPSHGQTIFQYDRTATGAVAYRRLADEILYRCRKVGR